MEKYCLLCDLIAIHLYIILPTYIFIAYCTIMYSIKVINHKFETYSQRWLMDITIFNGNNF